MLQNSRSSSDLRLTQIAKAYCAYQKRLKDNNALDFDDILYVTVKLLQQEPEVREYYQRKFQYVLVDEYQDTNHVQYLLTSLLSGHWGNICVVGDDDQSIYRFRGATIENILRFCATLRTAVCVLPSRISLFITISTAFSSGIFSGARNSSSSRSRDVKDSPFAAYIWISPVATSVAESVVPVFTGCKFKMEKFNLNPFSGKLRITEVHLSNPETGSW